MKHMHPNPDLVDLRFGKVLVEGRVFSGVWSSQDIFFLSNDQADVLKKAMEYCPWLKSLNCRPASFKESETLAKALKAFYKGTKVPLRPNPAGTGFQLQVWKALLGIPRGQTQSYGAIAKAIGKPKAYRAVGTACGKNPVAFLVPCHRVIQSSGGLGGFGLSLSLKQYLLDLESTNHQASAR